MDMRDMNRIRVEKNLTVICYAFVNLPCRQSRKKINGAK